MYSNQLEEVGLDLFLLPRTTESALAVMHWAAKIDGNDVEFIVGSRAEKPKAHRIDFQHRITKLFLLDFGQCKQAALDKAEVARRIRMFLSSDPYYPRPHTSKGKDEQRWIAFKQEYLKTSRAILHSNKHTCAELIIHHIEKQVGKAMAVYEKDAYRG